MPYSLPKKPPPSPFPFPPSLCPLPPSPFPFPPSLCPLPPPSALFPLPTPNPLAPSPFEIVRHFALYLPLHIPNSHFWGRMLPAKILDRVTPHVSDALPTTTSSPGSHALAAPHFSQTAPLTKSLPRIPGRLSQAPRSLCRKRRLRAECPRPPHRGQLQAAARRGNHPQAARRRLAEPFFDRGAEQSERHCGGRRGGAGNHGRGQHVIPEHGMTSPGCACLSARAADGVLVVLQIINYVLFGNAGEGLEGETETPLAFTRPRCNIAGSITPRLDRQQGGCLKAGTSALPPSS